MKKTNLLGVGFCFVFMLSACGNETEKENEVLANSISSEQLAISDKYKALIVNGDNKKVIQEYYRTFIKTENKIDTNEEIKKQYNIAVTNIVDNSVEEVVKIESLLDYLTLTDETINLIQTKKKEIIDADKDRLYKLYEEKLFQEDYGKFNFLSHQDEEFNAMYEYMMAKKYQPDGIDNVENLMKKVSPDYGGMFNGLIKQAISDNSKTFYWLETYNKANKIQTPNPRIGMTEEEVINSSWGEPQSKNRTVTSISVREQWVYPNYKYLYFKDGILISFQD